MVPFSSLVLCVQYKYMTQRCTEIQVVLPAAADVQCSSGDQQNDGRKFANSCSWRAAPYAYHSAKEKYLNNWFNLYSKKSSNRKLLLAHKDSFLDMVCMKGNDFIGCAIWFQVNSSLKLLLLFLQQCFRLFSIPSSVFTIQFKVSRELYFSHRLLLVENRFESNLTLLCLG